MTLCVGHRGGSSLAPENTLAAFDAGVAAGADCVECDVHLSADGCLVVIHDDDLQRTTNRTGKVGRLTLQQIQEANAGAKFYGGYAPQQVPTFEAVLERLAGRVGLQVEIKTPEGQPYEGIERLVVEHLRRAGLVDRSIVLSFDREALVRSKAASSDISTCYLVSHQHVPTGRGTQGENIALATLACGASMAGLDLHLISPDLVARIRDFGIGVAVWTVNEPSQMRDCKALNLDAIATDRPDVLRRVLDAAD